MQTRDAWLMALDTDPESIDWVARNTTGVIDFRLADDPWRVPDEVYNVRMVAYMRQVLPRGKHGRGSGDSDTGEAAPRGGR